jgi:P-type E1-E2 ATPase
LTIVGVTAVEDLLQDRVSETIQDFKEAGMKVWMLTGDKGTTAKMIGIKCKLIPQSSLEFVHKKSKK